jgi:hypothetical protein
MTDMGQKRINSAVKLLKPSGFKPTAVTGPRGPPSGESAMGARDTVERARERERERERERGALQ